MRVEVEAAAWACGRTDVYRELHRLLARAATGQHTVVAGGDASDIIDGPFFEKAVAKNDKEDWRELLTRTLAADKNAPEPNPVPRAVVGLTQVFSRSLATGFTLAPNDVGQWAEEHLEVLLENDTDWLLVQWAASIAAATGSPELANAIEWGWARKNGRGGTGELLKSVEDPRQYRCFAVVDSDRDAWAGPGSAKAQEIKETGDTTGIPVHVLAGRELENYVPGPHWWEVVLQGVKRKPAQGAREVHLWGRIKTILVLKREEFEKKHGKPAFAKVLQRVESQAARKTSEPSARALLLERSSMMAEERAVDDLVARLGRKRAAEGVKRAVQSLASFDPTQLDDVIADDLTKLAVTLSRWL
jgi:hypothetical protein